MRVEDSLSQGTGTGWEIVIGLEVHAQILSHTKLFSAAPTTFGASPNTQVSFVDAGFPGMLPVLNQYCVEQAVRTGLGLNAQINLFSRFDRKHYFYPDLPQGYQITQYYQPIVGAGEVFIDIPGGGSKKIGIHHLHLEQDAGKSIHDLDSDSSYIDLNRAGIALMEIVTNPDMRSAQEAALFLKKLRSILRYLGTCDGNMEEGSLRADVNISLCRPGGAWGTRVEIKNVNSIRFMQQAITFEVNRQSQILDSGGTVLQETRLFDSKDGVTCPMRSKENAPDYRYFPDPDLLPLVISQEWVDSIGNHMPELPDSKAHRFVQQWGLSFYDASVLVSEKDLALFFEESVACSPDQTPQIVKLIANWVMGEFSAAWNRSHQAINELPVKPQNISQLVNLIVSGEISGKMAKDVFESMWDTGLNPEDIVRAQGLKQVNDKSSIQEAVSKVMIQYFDKVVEYRQGKEKLFGFFVGQVMKVMQGQGNPELINEVLKEMLIES